MTASSIDQLRSVATDARQRLADLALAENVRAELLADAVPDEVDDLLELDTAVTKAARKVELQREIVQRADQVVADAEQAAAIDAATQAEREALSDYLTLLTRAHAASMELAACREALPDIVSRVNGARRITGRKERFAPTYVPLVQPLVIGHIESAIAHLRWELRPTGDDNSGPQR